MIEVCNHPEENPVNWQSEFVKLLPELEQRLKRAFPGLDAEAREDAIQEGIIHALFSFVRLSTQDRARVVSPSNLAWYAAKQVRRGRPAVGRMSSKEPLSTYAQLGKGRPIRRQRWIELMVDDRRAPIADQVAVRIDAHDWLSTLSRSMKQLAKDLALGFSTSEVARKHGVTAGRISQLRRTLQRSWLEFQHELAPNTAN